MFNVWNEEHFAAAAAATADSFFGVRIYKINVW